MIWAYRERLVEGTITKACLRWGLFPMMKLAGRLGKHGVRRRTGIVMASRLQAANHFPWTQFTMSHGGADSGRAYLSTPLYGAESFGNIRYFFSMGKMTLSNEVR